MEKLNEVFDENSISHIQRIHLSCRSVPNQWLWIPYSALFIVEVRTLILLRGGTSIYSLGTKVKNKKIWRGIF